MNNYVSGYMLGLQMKKTPKIYLQSNYTLNVFCLWFLGRDELVISLNNKYFISKGLFTVWLNNKWINVNLMLILLKYDWVNNILNNRGG